MSPDLNSVSQKLRPGVLMLAALLAIILSSGLFALPQPSIATTHPYRVEMLLAGFLILVLIVIRRRYKLQPSGEASVTRAIAFSVLVWVSWSAASYLWASFLGGVIHHTLLWWIYLSFFVLTAVLIRRSAAFVTTTFIVVSILTAVVCLVDYAAISDFASSELTLRARYAKSGEMLATLLPVLCAASIYARKQSYVLLTAAALGWVALMLSLSKGAFVAGTAGFIFFFVGAAILSSRAFRKRVLVLAAAWVVVTVGTQLLSGALFSVPSTTDYITGAADPSRTSSSHRLFIWNIAARMAADNWPVGVGADNFGPLVNRSRTAYRESHPDNPSEEFADIYLIDRAHNEALQVLSELGVIGLFLFSLPFVIFVFCFLRTLYRANYRLPPILWGAIAGMTAFFVSSQFSSFSFRKGQNGIVFFMVFAVAVNEVAKLSRRNKARATPVSAGASLVFAAMGAVFMLAFCFTRLMAEYNVYRAERSPTYATAKEHYQFAVAADPEYAGAYLSHAGRASMEGDTAEAARLTQLGIEKGIGLSLTYSYLAKWRAESGDQDGADAAFREALAIYPRSIFLRTEYAAFLAAVGRTSEAETHLAHARSINLRHANGWQALIKDGSVRAFYRAKNDPEIVPPAELAPQQAVYKYLDAQPGTNEANP